MQSAILPFNRNTSWGISGRQPKISLVEKSRLGKSHISDDEPRQLYYDLLSRNITAEVKASSQQYLERQLEKVQQLKAGVPENMSDLEEYLEQEALKVGEQYRQYLETRKAGGPRRYFSSRAHALNFIKSVAPTKLVDGAWLHGLTAYWNDARYASLIRIYLEELGEGEPARNHVLIYKKLLAELDCEDLTGLSEDHFTQGAIQLSLAQHTSKFLPEVIGFNLGYEQLPLHLLITAYELHELGIDSSYFTLHITIDNRASGHAKKSIEALMQAMPVTGDPADYYRRVINGYKLNMLGAGTVSVIDSFDLYDELIDILKAKSRYGRNMHSDHCRFGGHTVNEWLSDPELLPDFIHVLEQKGWINRHQDPQNSRFWQLLEGDNAKMFGVFTEYEKQVIYEWIAGDWYAENTAPRVVSGIGSGHIPAHMQDKLLAKHEATDSYADEYEPELTLLQEKVANVKSREEVFTLLGNLISPVLHYTPAGLMATRIYASMLKS
jgi:heme oxygenase-like protein